MSDLGGINLAMQTPMHADGSIDYARWEELIDLYIDAGVHGIISAGTTGEYYAQSMEERFELMKFIKKRIRGRVAFIVGTGALRTSSPASGLAFIRVTQTDGLPSQSRSAEATTRASARPATVTSVASRLKSPGHGCATSPTASCRAGT